VFALGADKLRGKRVPRGADGEGGVSVRAVGCPRGVPLGQARLGKGHRSRLRFM